jgi:hypothetical protein
MAWIDKLDTFSSAQAVTASAISDVKEIVKGYTGTSQSNATVDLGCTPDDIYLEIRCDETVTSGGGSATVTFTLESDSTANLATSATVHWSTAAIAQATLVAGYKVATIKLPSGDYEKYLGVRYTVASGPLTAGKFTAYLTNAADIHKNFAVGTEIG